MNIRIGINPITWTNDDMPELGGDTSLETCLSEACAAGFSGVELGNKFPRTPDDLRAVLERHQLRLISGWYSGRLLERSVEEERRALEPHLALLKALGCPVLIYAETARAVHGDRRRSLSSRPVLAEREWAPLARAIGELSDHVAGRGLELVVHHHMGTVIQTEPEIDRLMAETPPSTKLLLDTGHLTYAGGDPVRVASRHGVRIRHVHAKDVRARVLARVLAEDRPFLESVLEGVFTVPGDGAVDFDGVFTALRGARYEGWIVVEAEQDPRVAHPFTYAKMGFENTLSKAVGVGLIRAGFTC